MKREAIERAGRAISWVLTALLILSALSLAVSCVRICLLGDAPFTRERVGEALARLSPLLCLTLAVLLASLIMQMICVVRFGKQGRPRHGIRPDATPAERPRRLRAVRIAILAVSLICILMGALNGSMQDVLGKAIRICTECIGLG